MKEDDFAQKVRRRLAHHYGSERVGMGHSLSDTRLRPDLVVYETPERDKVFLVVEVKTGDESNARFRSGREQLFEYLENSEAQYGAIMTPDLDYFFSYGADDVEPTTLSSFPGIQDVNSGRPLDSAAEARFLLRQLLDDLRAQNLESRGFDVKADIFLALLYQITAERKGVEIDTSTHLEDQLGNLQDSLETYFDTLNGVDTAPRVIEVTRATFNYFGSFELSKTPADVAPGFFDELAGRAEMGAEQLSREVAKPMVDFAGVEAGDRVLDPASGFGVLCREIAGHNASATGVEITEGATIVAVFLNELGTQGNKIDSVRADFFEWAPDDETALNAIDPFDQIVLNPPVGGRISSERIPELGGSRSEIRLEEAFIARSISLLKEGGTMVALVPEYVLAGEQSKELRDFLLHHVTFEAIITFGGGVFSDVSFRGAVVRVRKSYSPYQQSIATINVSSEPEYNGPEDIGTAIEIVQEGGADTLEIDPDEVRTLLPSQIRGEKDVLEVLHDQYDKVTNLEHVAAIASGTTRKPEKADTGLPYLDTTREVKLEELSVRSPDDVSTIATPTDVLISIKGGDTIVRRVDREVIPSSRWAVLQFDSDQKATQYQNFFESDLGKQILEANRTGSAIRYITISALRELPVPDFTTEVEPDGV